MSASFRLFVAAAQFFDVFERFDPLFGVAAGRTDVTRYFYRLESSNANQRFCRRRAGTRGNPQDIRKIALRTDFGVFHGEIIAPVCETTTAR